MTVRFTNEAMADLQRIGDSPYGRVCKDGAGWPNGFTCGNLVNIAKEMPVQVTVHAAKTHLSKLIEAVLAGEEVVIARRKQPVVRLVPVARSQFIVGPLKGQLTGPGPDFFEPMDQEELALWESAE